MEKDGLLERNVTEKASLEERRENVRKLMAELPIYEQRLTTCIDAVSDRIESLQQELCTEQTVPANEAA